MRLHRSKTGFISFLLVLILKTGYTASPSSKNHNMADANIVVRINVPENIVCAGSRLTIEVELQNVSRHSVHIDPRGIDVIHYRPIPTDADRGPERIEPSGEQPANTNEGSIRLYRFLDSAVTSYSYDVVDPLPGEKKGASIDLQVGRSHRYSVPLFLDVKGHRFYKVGLEYSGLLANSKTSRSGTNTTKTSRSSNEIILEVRECD